jgi:tetratricopeptide (TPR) repeat protein
VYEQILDLGLDRDAVQSLEALYTSQEQWSELVRLYERQLDESPRSPADLRVKIANVAASQGDFERSFEELEHALQEDRQHAGAVAELERLLSKAPDAEHRARAAALLEPVYLVRADYNKVMDSLQARLSVAVDPDVKREILLRLAQLYEEQKEDYQSALETVARLYHEDLADESTANELERLARVAGAEKRLAEIYAARPSSSRSIATIRPRPSWRGEPASSSIDWATTSVRSRSTAARWPSSPTAASCSARSTPCCRKPKRIRIA